MRSDEFIEKGDGRYLSNVSSILVDAQENVWVAYHSRPVGSWSSYLTTIKKMACVRN